MQCNKDLKVEIYPIKVKLCVYPHVNEVVSFCEGTTLSKHSIILSSFMIIC